MRRTTYSMVALLVFAVGCGGGQKTGDDDDSGGGGWLKDSEDEYEPADDTLVPPEKYDEISQALERRGPRVSRCFAQAIESGAVKPNTKGTVIVGLGILPDGKVTDVKILPASSIKEKAVTDCVIEEIHMTRMPTLPKRVDTSYTYKLDRDY